MVLDEFRFAGKPDRCDMEPTGSDTAHIGATLEGAEIAAAELAGGEAAVDELTEQRRSRSTAMAERWRCRGLATRSSAARRRDGGRIQPSCGSEH